MISDQHNAKCLGTYGHSIVKTPNLDRLAGEGVRFTSAISQAAICTPSRVCFLSGQYVHNHGIYGNGERAPQIQLPTFLGHFRSEGYRTAAIGKTHCPPGWVQADCDVYLGASAETDMPPGVKLSDYDRYLDSKGLLSLRDDDVYPEQTDHSMQPKDARCSRLSYEDSVEGWCAREARRFITENRNAPWCVHVGLQRPHQLYCPAKPFWEMYPGDLPIPPNADADLSLKAPHLRRMRAACEAGREESLFGEKGYKALRQRKLRGYYGLVSQTDYAVGELLALLHELRLEQDTIVIYTSDHGEYACEFGLLEKAPGICSDAVTRIPSIWRWPGHFKAGHVSREIMETVDVAVTLPRLSGLPEFPTADGRDITPLLRGESVEVHRVGVTENPLSRSLRKGPWRFVYYPPEMFASESGGNSVGELYNLDDDPWEMKNLFYDPAQQGRVAEMRKELLDWLVASTRVVTAHPPFQAMKLYDKTGSRVPVAELLQKGWDTYL